MTQINDEFNWDIYTSDLYEKEIRNSDFDMEIKSFSIENDDIVFKDNIHLNHRELYYQVYKLGVKSVYECGFGCGMHLINIHKINPDININGCDYLKSQLDFGVRFLNIDKYDFYNKLEINDFSIPISDNLPKYDFVFSHAVTMHLSDSKAITFINNMKLISNKYIFLIENIKQHNYDDIFKKTFYDYDRINTSKYINNGILFIKNNDKRRSYII